MKAIYKNIVLAILGALILNNTVFSKEEFTKNISKEYKASSATTLEIINKYGQIHIENWEKSTIKIDVKIMVDNDRQDEAEKLLNMITVDFSEEGDYIKAITKIDEGFGTSKYWKNRDGKNFSIDYKVFIPKDINLKLSHRYGNIFINELSGLLQVDLRYGNLNINKLTRGDNKPLNTISLGYGKATIEYSNWLKLNVSYSSDVSLLTGKALIIVSKYSKIRVDKASSLVIESAYDNYKIGTLSNFVLSGKYSHYKIETLTKKLDADIKYGGIDIDLITETFESIVTNSSYSGIKLGISPQASYKLDGKVRYAGIDFPNTGKVSRITENTSVTVYGYVGGSNPKAKVSIVSSYGGVDLRP